MTPPITFRIPLRVCRRLLFALSLLAPASALFAAPAVWRDPATGFAIAGYDPVAYYTQKGPALGREDVEHSWGGAVWQFASLANRDVFAKHPEIYAPGFAGYDAHLLSKGVTVQGVPLVWGMYKGRVYFFLDAANLRQWQRDPQKATAAAQANWTRLARDLPGTSER